MSGREERIAELRDAIDFAHEEQRQGVELGRSEETMTLFQHWSATAGWLASRIRKIEVGDEPNWPDAMNSASEAASTVGVLKFDPPDDAAIVTAELLIVSYVREDGTSGYMVQARGEMPATTYLGLTVMAQDEIKGWGR